MIAKIIVQVRESKQGNKSVTIPKNSKIKKGDYVVVKKLEEKDA